MLSYQPKSSILGIIAIIIPLAITIGAGCAKKTSDSGAAVDTKLVSAGKTVYDANGCGRCHALGGQGGGRAPELTHVGSEATHTADWLVAHVKNPRSHNPNSRMPGFAGKISDSDLLALGAYLASQK